MQITKPFLIASLLLCSATVLAQTVYEKGRAAVSYTGKSAPQAVKDQASQMAQTKAIETYYAEAGESELTNFDKIREQILGNLDRYVLDAAVVSEEDRTDIKQYAVTVRVRLNVAALHNAVKDNSAVSGVAKSAKSRLTFLFVARQANDETVYDARVYQRVDASAKANGTSSISENGTEGESIAKGQVSTNASKTSTGTAVANASVTVERGGSSTHKASETTWRLFPISDLSSVFTGSFDSAGFKVLDAADVEPYSGGKLRVVAVQDDYKSGQDLKSQTLADVEAGLRNAQIPYLAFGTLDVGFANKDPATGLLRVAVTVNAKILDLTEVIPERVATVGPVQFAGLGPTEREAQTNALKIAAQNASRELISQVTNKGLH
jgi:hypothetical protein